MSDMNYKNINETSAKMLASLNEQSKRWFTLADAHVIFSDKTENQVRVQIKRMTDNGLLMRIRAGVYYIIPHEQDSEMKVYLNKDNLCSLYQIEKIINSNLIW